MIKNVRNIYASVKRSSLASKIVAIVDLLPPNIIMLINKTGCNQVLILAHIAGREGGDRGIKSKAI